MELRTVGLVFLVCLVILLVLFLFRQDYLYGLSWVFVLAIAFTSIVVSLLSWSRHSHTLGEIGVGNVKVTNLSSEVLFLIVGLASVGFFLYQAPTSFHGVGSVKRGDIERGKRIASGNSDGRRVVENPKELPGLAVPKAEIPPVPDKLEKPADRTSAISSQPDPTNFERFSNLMSGIASTVFAIAVIGAVIWAVFHFRVLRSSKKAKPELQTVQRALRERGVLNVELSAADLPARATEEHRIVVNVKITNVGNMTEVVTWNNANLYALKVDHREEIQGKKANDEKFLPIHGACVAVDKRADSVLPTQTHVFPFIFNVPDPGFYLIVFEAPASPLERELLAKELKAVDQDKVVWQGFLYHTVESREEKALSPRKQADKSTKKKDHGARTPGSKRE